jgi:hypothetical protein
MNDLDRTLRLIQIGLICVMIGGVASLVGAIARIVELASR